jgi:hypothetical protein
MSHRPELTASSTKGRHEAPACSIPATGAPPIHTTSPLSTFARRATMVVLSCMLLTGASPALDAQAAATSTTQNPASCRPDDNLNDLAGRFISRCRKASIRRVFPAQHLGETLGQIKNGPGLKSYKTAWKLLNDGRFVKDSR